MDLKNIVYKYMDWVHLVQDRVKWWTLVNKVITFNFHKKWGIA
jgi:hypothetical protein